MLNWFGDKSPISRIWLLLLQYGMDVVNMFILGLG